MIVTVIGARPQFVKAAIVSRALQRAGLQESVIHTGQHYDEKMSDVFWRELGLPECSVNLESGSGTHGAQTAYMIERIEAYLMNLKPAASALLLYGDTNSTIAGAIAASKLQVPIIHIEAGLRSFNRSMPEEINRIVTDHLSSMLFCSSDEGVRQLAKEGITDRVVVSGDVMFDALKTFTGEAEKKVDLNGLLPFAERPFCLVTLHRPANTENRENLSGIFDSLRATGMPVLWPIHPRMRSKLSQIELPGNVFVTDPLSYFEMLTALKHCYKVFTDSGGLQKEAYWMKRPCITLRTETEWVETVHDDWNTITGADATLIQNAFKKKVDPDSWYPLYGSGNASDLIASHIKDYLK